MVTAPTCIIAYVGEDETHYKHVVDLAIEAARSEEARLILYDADAGTTIGGSPLPTWWDADGQKDMFGDKLSPTDLERAGRPAVASEVRHCRDMGIDAWGWLPSSKRAKKLAEYADKQGADLLIVPSDLDDVGILGRLQGEAKPEEIAKEAERQVLVVDVDATEGGSRGITPEGVRIEREDRRTT